jgi:hypothetical protein
VIALIHIYIYIYIYIYILYFFFKKKQNVLRTGKVGLKLKVRGSHVHV